MKKKSGEADCPPATRFLAIQFWLRTALLEEEDIGVGAVALDGAVEVNCHHALCVAVENEACKQGSVVDDHCTVLSVVQDDPSTSDFLVLQDQSQTCVVNVVDLAGK